MKYQVGQTVYLHPAYNPRSNPPYTATITKVGRKWVTVGEGWREERFDPETGRTDPKGFGSNYSVYASEADYLAAASLEEAWRSMRQAIDRLYRAPADVTIERIAEARLLLGIA